MREFTRRELTFWSNWGSLLAVLSFVCTTGVVLSEKILGLSSYMSSYQLGMGLREHDGSDLVFVVALVLALCLWSWLAGFAVGSLSGRAVWLTGALLYFAVNNSFLLLIGSVRYGSLHAPPLPQFLLDMLFPRVEETFLVFALPALWGILHGYKRGTFVFRHALMLVVIVTTLTAFVTWTSETHEVPEGGWRTPVPTFPWQVTLLSSPMVYILASARRRELT